MVRCLITGGTGLVGKRLIEEMSEDFEIFLYSRNNPNIANRKIHYLKGDLFSLNEKDLPPRIDVVIHLAQSLYYREFPEKAEDIFNVNTLSLFKLLNYARSANAQTFVYTSTGGIYGAGNEPFQTDSPILVSQDLSFYQSTKLCSELLAKSFQEFFNVVSLRPFFVYGEGQRKEMLFPRLIESVLCGKAIRLESFNGIRINPIHARDAAKVIKATLEIKQSETFNIAGSEIVSLRDICKTIGHVVGKSPIFEIDANSSQKSLIGDIEKTIQILGVQPVISLSEGIEGLIHNG